MKKGDYAIVMNENFDYGFRVFQVKENSLELIKEMGGKRVFKPRDLEEGDEVVVSFGYNKVEVYGLAEITLIDYSQKKSFSIYMSENSTNPGESFHVNKEDIKFKLIEDGKEK